MTDINKKKKEERRQNDHRYDEYDDTDIIELDDYGGGGDGGDDGDIIMAATVNKGRGDNKDGVPPVYWGERKNTKGRCICLKYATVYGYKLPVHRLLCIASALCLQLLLYVEDPVVYSKSEARVWGWGSVFNFVFRYYPSTAVYPGWFALKLCFVLGCTLLGYLWGKYLLGKGVLGTIMNHGLFKRDRGSWASGIAGCLVLLYWGSLVYNLLLENRWISSYLDEDNNNNNNEGVGGGGGGEISMRQRFVRPIDDRVGVSEEFLGFGVLLTIVYCYAYYIFFTMDAMISTATKADDKKRKLYGCRSKSCNSLRNEWNSGTKCILFVWYGIISVVVGLYGAWIYYRGYYYYGPQRGDGGATAAATTAADFTPHGYFGWDEVKRRWVASLALTLLLFSAMQDWDFPKFKLSNGAVYKANGCKGRFNVEIHRRWALAGAWFLLVAVSTNVLLNQIRYVPHDYAQITDCQGKIRATYDFYDGLPVRLRPYRNEFVGTRDAGRTNATTLDPYCLMKLYGSGWESVYNVSDRYDIAFSRNCVFPVDYRTMEECYDSTRSCWIPVGIVTFFLVFVTVMSRIKEVCCRSRDGGGGGGEEEERGKNKEKSKKSTRYANRRRPGRLPVGLPVVS